MANMIVREPFDASLRKFMDRFFDDSFWRMPNPFVEEGALPLDIYERDGRIWVEASLPGYREDEIDVQVHEGVLSITARRSEGREETGERWYRRERHQGAVNRRIALPGMVDQADVEATLDHGVLTLSVPLPERARPKQIEVKAKNGS